jgi:hypothetical protein
MGLDYEVLQQHKRDLAMIYAWLGRARPYQATPPSGAAPTPGAAITTCAAIPT